MLNRNTQDWDTRKRHFLATSSCTSSKWPNFDQVCDEVRDEGPKNQALVCPNLSCFDLESPSSSRSGAGRRTLGVDHDRIRAPEGVDDLQEDQAAADEHDQQ
jgi:hypothetical protein